MNSTYIVNEHVNALLNFHFNSLNHVFLWSKPCNFNTAPLTKFTYQAKINFPQHKYHIKLLGKCQPFSIILYWKAIEMEIVSKWHHYDKVFEKVIQIVPNFDHWSLFIHSIEKLKCVAFLQIWQCPKMTRRYKNENVTLRITPSLLSSPF